jgi:2-keto-4-pentenoate hydratase/2-oxohepta-3-ene-1,7-dioic acid hydratase in catechol pathway
MAIQVVRTLIDDRPTWGVHRSGTVTLLPGDWPTTGEFLTGGGADAARSIAGTVADRTPEISLDELRVLSPVTKDGDYICQGLNYASHLRELGLDPGKAVHNIIFHKASSSLCGANDDIVRPAGVRALDYEVELGLVVGASIEGPVEVSSDNLHQLVGGLVITNDISARDVQIACEQFCKGKSYRTFGPTGPFLVLLSPSELERWEELVLSLSVNGELRQRALASDMIHQPAATLRELSQVRDLVPGDLIATGTPAGVALEAPGRIKAKLAMLMSPARRAAIVARMADRDPRYLRPGDVITASIETEDGAIALGQQENRVVEAGQH